MFSNFFNITYNFDILKQAIEFIINNQKLQNELTSKHSVIEYLDNILKTNTEKNNELLDLLRKHKHPNEFIHAIYALDVNRMKKIYLIS